MNMHQNARMTRHGRLLLVQRICLQGWRAAEAAAAAGVSVRTAYKWVARYRTGGESALHDRRSTPGRSPRRTPAEVVAAIDDLRRQRLSGPRIARRLGLPVSTVGAVLRRLGLGRLKVLDERPEPMRYQRQRPGELIHIDSKKLGRIDGIGHRITGDRTGQSSKRGTGWEALHVAVDDASRLAYTELLPNERKHHAIAFLERALAFFAAHGVVVEGVMTDNGAAYKSYDFAAACRTHRLRHLRTRPYRPCTNGKAERFIQSALREWLYAKPYTRSAERAADRHSWLYWYNHHRPHAALKAKPPASILNNVLGNDI